MFVLCILLVFVTASRSQDVHVDESQLHPLSDEYIEYINNVQSLWQAGRNFEINTPIEHLRRFNGVIRSEDPWDIQEKQFSVNMMQGLPESFDAREHWPHCPSLSEIRDQGDCGSCWAISATEVMTDRICIASEGKVQFHFSTFDLLTCCINCSDGCKGGDPFLGWKHWNESGIVSGGNYDSKDRGCKPYPFPQTNPKIFNLKGFENLNEDFNCSHQCVSSDLDYETDRHFGKDYYSVPANEDVIKAEILMNGPVQAAMQAFFDFVSYKSGVYRALPNQKLWSGHAVKILGWGVENGTKYWLVANSMGKLWGDNGFFKIVRGENHCGIESDILTGEPLL